MSASSLLGLPQRLAASPSRFARATRSLRAHPFFSSSGSRSFAALPLRPSPARDSALSRTLPLRCKPCSVRTGTSRRTRAHPACFGSRIARLAATRAAMNPPKPAENIELPYLWLRNDGGTEPKKGALRFVLLARIPFRGKVARTISARHALLADSNPRAKLRTALLQAAKLNSRNLFNIAIAASLRQHGRLDECGASMHGTSQVTRAGMGFGPVRSRAC
jgi:hypothetical protein